MGTLTISYNGQVCVTVPLLAQAEMCIRDRMQIPCIVPVLPCVLTGQLQQLQRIEEGLRLQLEQNQQMVIGLSLIHI